LVPGRPSLSEVGFRLQAAVRMRAMGVMTVVAIDPCRDFFGAVSTGIFKE